MKSHAMTAFALVLSIEGAMGSYVALNAVWAQVKRGEMANAV